MQRVEVQLEDDLTGGPADETVNFSLDGRDYQIDLNAKHADRFRRQLAPFLDHARLARAQRSRTPTRTAASREHSRQIRLWAEDQGLPVSAHGRLPREIMQRYDRSHNGSQPAEEPRRRKTARR